MKNQPDLLAEARRVLTPLTHHTPDAITPSRASRKTPLLGGRPRAWEADFELDPPTPAWTIDKIDIACFKSYIRVSQRFLHG